MRSLSVDDILLLHRKLIDRTGGSQGVRDMRLIESAINRAFATFDGKDLYTTLEAKIAAITYGLVNNHGFVDGNKRIGVTAMLLLLRLNEYRLMYNQDELVEFGLGLATGTIDEASIRQWIEHHKV